MNKLKLREFAFFGFAGVLGYGADVSVTMLLSASMGPYFARIPAFVVAATVTWLFNRTFTFSATDKRHDSLAAEFLHYLGLMVLGLVVNYAVYVLSVMILGDSSCMLLVCVALGSLAGMLVNYFNSKRYLYRTKKSDS